MFKSARIKLTAWYVLIIMIVSGAFSLAIYQVLTAEIDRFAQTQQFRIERRLREQYLLPPGIVMIDPELATEARRRIVWSLVIINLAIGGAAAVTGYFLAGKTLAPIEEMIEEQNRFISDASHELRTPLTALKCSLEVYLREKKPKLVEAKSLAKDSLGEVNKLQALSDSLLRLAQFQKPNGQVKMERVNLKKIIDLAVGRVEPMAEAKKIKLVSRGTDGMVMGHETGLTDLLVILLDNAIKYSPNGSKVTIRVTGTKKEMTVTVKDEGIGISQEDLPHIFDRFYRADSARNKNKAGGYGLGLAIAKKIAEEHRGVISVESKINEGSEFKVKLPTAIQQNFRIKT